MVLSLGLFFSIVGVVHAQLNYTNPFRSPSGVINIDVSPMVDQEVMPIVPGCQNIEFDPAEIAQDSMLWPWSGLIKVSRLLYEQYVQQSAINARTLRYKDNLEADLLKNQRRLQEQGTPTLKEIEATLVTASQCVARRVLLNELSVSGAVCSCLSSQSRKTYCEFTDAFILSIHCHDKMAKHVDKSLMCPTLLTKSRGIQLSSMCSGWVAGSISALNIDLYTLNFPDSTPDQIDAKIAAQEARAYYVGMKAVEALTKWTDAHLFCGDDNPDHEHLKDVQLLPSWESKLYFWIVEPSGRKLPLAVVAQRTPNDGTIKATENTIIVIRNLRTTFEGRLFFANQQTRKYVLQDIGPVHEGYDAVASLLLGPLITFFKTFFKTVVPLYPKITTIAHGNFGAGIGAIIARDLSTQFITADGGMVIEHNFLAFEGGPVGGYEFTSDLQKRVNVRNIVSDHSGYSELPCQSVKGCNRMSQIYTGELGVEIGPYLRLPGRVTVDSIHLANDVWRAKTAKLETVANMHCAIPCWLATKFCVDDPSPRCSYEDCGGFVTDEVKQINNRGI